MYYPFHRSIKKNILLLCMNELLVNQHNIVIVYFAKIKVI